MSIKNIICELLSIRNECTELDVYDRLSDLIANLEEALED